MEGFYNVDIKLFYQAILLFVEFTKSKGFKVKHAQRNLVASSS